MTFFKHPQSGRHGRKRRCSSHHIFSERHVNVRNGKEDKHIHTGVVDRSDSLSVARKTKDPTEPAHPTRIPPPGLGIKRKAGNDHDETAQNKHGKHRQLCQRVMAGILRCTLFKKEIVENLSQYALPPLQRPKRGNKNHARITIPDNCPKDTINKEHREDHAGDKVRKADVTEVVSDPGIP